MREYKKRSFAEWLRQKCRTIDFSILINSLNIDSNTKSFSTIQSILFEFGPGNTPLHDVKYKYFSDIRYIDAVYYPESGISNASFFKFDLDSDKFDELKYYINNNQGTKTVFADHCFEHISQNRFMELIDVLLDEQCNIFFRVPNIYSAEGLANFNSDNTHQNDFNHEIRQKLIAKGFSIIPWLRFYRISQFIKKAIRRLNISDVADEVLIYKISAK